MQVANTMVALHAHDEFVHDFLVVVDAGVWEVPV